MLGHLSIAAISALVLASSEQSTPGASVGAGNPYPVSNYTCEDGTHLAVRLLGDRASVSVGGATPIDLPSVGQEGTTFSNGMRTLFKTRKGDELIDRVEESVRKWSSFAEQAGIAETEATKIAKAFRKELHHIST